VDIENREGFLERLDLKFPLFLEQYSSQLPLPTVGTSPALDEQLETTAQSCL